MGIKQSSALKVRLHPRLTLLSPSSLTPPPPPPPRSRVPELAVPLRCTKVLFTSCVQCARPRLASGDFIRVVRCCLPRDLLCTGEVACGPRTELAPTWGGKIRGKTWDLTVNTERSSAEETLVPGACSSPQGRGCGGPWD